MCDKTGHFALSGLPFILLTGVLMTTEITLTPAERERLRDQLSDYCSEHFELELEQFDAEFFVDFVIDKLGPAFYNAGIEEAIRTHLAWSERIQEEMDVKKIL